MTIKRITALLSSLVLTLSPLSPCSLGVSAETTGSTEKVEAAITLGTAALDPDDSLYYGTYFKLFENEYDDPFSPIRWLVLTEEANGDTFYDSTPYLPAKAPGKPVDGRVYTDVDEEQTKYIYIECFDQYYKQTASDGTFLLSATCLEEMPYSWPKKDEKQSYLTDYRYGMMWTWSNYYTYGMTDENGEYREGFFTGAEKNGVLKTSKASTTSPISNALIADPIFPLSLDEYSMDYMEGKRAYKDFTGAENVHSYLRTAYDEQTSYQIKNTGTVVTNNPYWSARPYRPAFNLDDSRVFFTTPAANGKTVSVGTYAENTTYTGNEYKATLLDYDRSFAIDAVIDNALPRFTVAYSGACTGENEYISFLYADKDGSVLKYGQLAHLKDASQSEGTLSFTLPSDYDFTQTFYLFNEQINADYKSDFASDPIAFDALQYDRLNFMLGTESFEKNDFIYYGSHNALPIKWRILTTNGDTLDKSASFTFYYDQSGKLYEGEPLFLFSEDALENVVFEASTADDGDEQETPNSWDLSDAQIWCNTTFVENAFSPLEKAQLVKFYKAKLANKDNTDSVYHDLAYFLSENEFDLYVPPANLSPLETRIDARSAKYQSDGTAAKWWLRSNSGTSSLLTVFGISIDENGSKNSSLITSTDIAARPATNLSKNNILFYTAAEGGKTLPVTSGTDEGDEGNEGNSGTTVDPDDGGTKIEPDEGAVIVKPDPGKVLATLSEKVVEGTDIIVKPDPGEVVVKPDPGVDIKPDPTDPDPTDPDPGDDTGDEDDTQTPDIGAETGMIGNTHIRTDSYKLTLLDPERTFSVAEKEVSGTRGETLTLSYENACVADETANEYISALIVRSGCVSYYARLAKAETESGTVQFTIPTDIAYGTYELRLFNEQINGDRMTDYASAFQTITLTVKKADGFAIESARVENDTTTVRFLATHAGTYTLILVNYDNGRLIGFEAFPVTITKEETGMYIDRTVEYVLEPGDKVLLWLNTEEISPLCEAYKRT